MGEIIITYPSKTAEDTVTVQDPVGESGTKLPEDFKVSHVVETEAINKEVAEMRSQRAEKKKHLSASIRLQLSARRSCFCPTGLIWIAWSPMKS